MLEIDKHQRQLWPAAGFCVASPSPWRKAKSSVSSDQNGAGKSTTLAAVAGGVTPHTGSIKLQGRGLVGMPPEAISRLGVSLVPEGPPRVRHAHSRRETCASAGFQRRDRGGARGRFRAHTQPFSTFCGERLQQPAGPAVRR